MTGGDSSQKALAERLSRRLAAWSKVPAGERAKYWKVLGVRDDRGDFTRNFDGDAEPLAESVAAIPEQAKIPPLDRLVLLLNHTDVVSLDAQTARVIAADGVDALRRVIAEGEHEQLLRRRDAVLAHDQPVASDDEDFVLELRLTENGRERARALSERVARMLATAPRLSRP